jgi:hypothetical protein
MPGTMDATTMIFDAIATMCLAVAIVAVEGRPLRDAVVCTTLAILQLVLAIEVP